MKISIVDKLRLLFAVVGVAISTISVIAALIATPSMLFTFVVGLLVAVCFAYFSFEPIKKYLENYRFG